MGRAVETPASPSMSATRYRMLAPLKRLHPTLDAPSLAGEFFPSAAANTGPSYLAAIPGGALMLGLHPNR